MKLKSFLSLACLAALLLWSCNSPQGTGTAKADLSIDYEKITLDNGLEVILHEDKSDPIVSVAIMFHVGSNREKPGKTGFAHFFEHMLFQDSENIDEGEFFKTIEDLGGDFNGGTWNDGTVYYEVIPKDALERILWMESDRMGFFINAVTEADLEGEKPIVQNEKRQRVDNQPYGHANYVIDKALYPEGHPYNWQVIGSLEDLDNATIADVKEFYEQWYGPNNATMVIAGDFDKAETKALVEKYFGEIKKKADVEKPKPQPGVLTETIKLYHEDAYAQLPELRLTFPTVEQGHPDQYALDALGELLTSGKRAPIYKELVENRKLAPNPYSYNSSQEIAGKFTINARGNVGVNLDSMYEAIMTALANFENDGINQKDLDRIKNRQETQFYNGISSILGKSFQLASYNEFYGSPDYLKTDLQNILDVTKEDVMRVYEKYIKDKPLIATSFVPKGQTDLVLSGSKVAEVVIEPITENVEKEVADTEVEIEKTPSSFDRTVKPALSGELTMPSPKIWETELSNGMKVLGMSNDELPLIQLSIRMKGGMLLDDPNKIGVANLMTDVMMEGTANKTPEDLEDAIGQLGASINMYTSAEHITINANCLKRNYNDVLALIEEILLEPRWDEKEFDRIKMQTVNSLRQQDANPSQVAGKVFNKIMYGEDHILSNNTFGDIATVESITIDDLKAFYEKNYSPSIATVHLVGAITKEEAVKSLKSLEANWEAKEVTIPEPGEPKTRSEAKLFFVDIPDAKQSVIQIGAIQNFQNSDEFAEAQVVNYRLGSGTSARLFQQLREEKGYTYGAYSYIPRRMNDTYFGASSSVRANVTMESVDLFTQIIEGYQEDYNEEDLEVTKSAMTRSSALEFETLYDKLGILQNISTYDLPNDYIKKQEAIVNGMTLDQAKGLIGKYINPDNMVYVVVGDATTQLPRLKNYNPVLVDKEAKPVNVTTVKN